MSTRLQVIFLEGFPKKNLSFARGHHRSFMWLRRCEYRCAAAAGANAPGGGHVPQSRPQWVCPISAYRCRTISPFVRLVSRESAEIVERQLQSVCRAIVSRCLDATDDDGRQVSVIEHRLGRFACHHLLVLYVSSAYVCRER